MRPRQPPVGLSCAIPYFQGNFNRISASKLRFQGLPPFGYPGYLAAPRRLHTGTRHRGAPSPAPLPAAGKSPMHSAGLPAPLNCYYPASRVRCCRTAVAQFTHPPVRQPQMPILQEGTLPTNLGTLLPKYQAPCSILFFECTATAIPGARARTASPHQTGFIANRKAAKYRVVVCRFRCPFDFSALRALDFHDITDVLQYRILAPALKTVAVLALTSQNIDLAGFEQLTDLRIRIRRRDRPLTLKALLTIRPASRARLRTLRFTIRLTVYRDGPQALLLSLCSNLDRVLADLPLRAHFPNLAIVHITVVHGHPTVAPGAEGYFPLMDPRIAMQWEFLPREAVLPWPMT
ncbi:hypothetical protein FB451DRAFT_1231616 [Mycena latifolia]|nr:hypothetical protein FB451DRAFT_1231616 [Mycena latifolia]